MRHIVRNEEAVIAKWGVRPESIPDYLAVVGDSADGFPGLQGWGPKSAALTFSRYLHLEDVPREWRQWHPSIRGAQRLSAVLLDQWNDALLFRTLATLRSDAPLPHSVDDLEWKGPRPEFERYCVRLQAPELFTRAMTAGSVRAAAAASTA
jgi:5'-3' exonuclease